MSEELMKALKLIKDECTGNQFCKDCPLRVANLDPELNSWCYLRNRNPINWHFKDDVPPEKPRVFGD